MDGRLVWVDGLRLPFNYRSGFCPIELPLSQIEIKRIAPEVKSLYFFIGVSKHKLKPAWRLHDCAAPVVQN